VVGEECNLEDQNESNVPYLEVQARQHKNCHRAEGWSASSPDTDLKDGRFDGIALGLIREGRLYYHYEQLRVSRVVIWFKEVGIYKIQPHVKP
jgi:hypothetical protein